MAPMEPIPETIEAAEELDRAATAPGTLLTALTKLANRAQEIVPDLVGVSVAPLKEGVTFTLVATAAEFAVLDAVQYAAGGPCVDCAHAGEIGEFDRDDLLDEERWRLFGQAGAARSVRSTLTLPIVAEGRVRGTVNLYAASGSAFAGMHGRLAELFGAWATGAVTNADLPFATRHNAETAARQLRDQTTVDVASGILAAQVGVDLASAEDRLRDAATRAGVPLVELARSIIRAREQADRDDA